jgi:hypothetical protein
MKPVLSRALVGVVLLAVSSLQVYAPAAAPPAGVDRARVRVLLRKLDADSFSTRQRADEALRAMGEPVLPLLRAERERTPSLEVRDRLDRMVRDLTFDQVARLVRLLGHANPRYRDLADRALRQSGSSVLPLLRKELRAGLDAQCRARLERIITDLTGARR